MNNIIWTTGHQLKLDNIIDSNNCFIFDSNGNRYIDLESGVWCTSVGHNNKRINQVITSQIGRIIHTGFAYCHPIISDVSEKVLETSGLKGGKCEFLCSGSEAVELGMRIARAVTDKPLAVTFKESYFGAYGDAALKSAESWFLYDRLNCSCNNSDEGCTGNCDDFNKIPFDKIGIFLLEPGSSSGMVRFPSLSLIEKIVENVRTNNGIIISNEITTGIGRTGKWFGFQHYPIQPDIVAMGKGIGNGYPVSVTAISSGIALKLNKIKFVYAQSHQNDPLGAFIIKEVIGIVEEENLLKKSVEMGNYLLNELLNLKDDYPIIKSIRGRGLILAIEFAGKSQEVYEKLFEKGYILCKRPNTEVLRLDPALTIENSTLDSFLITLGSILKNLQ
jgi:acetylornithine/N-succinyldiaminopimelate aminotransferase